MQSKLTKPWGPYDAGTVVADNATEVSTTTGAIHVNPDRFAKLHEGGYFEAKEPERPIPSEVFTGFCGWDRAAVTDEAEKGTLAGPELPQVMPDEAVSVDTRVDKKPARKEP